jgi:ATP-dependent RNA helicase RhlE
MKTKKAATPAARRTPRVAATARNATPATDETTPIVAPTIDGTLAQAEAATIDVTFADLGLTAPMLKALSDAGYKRPTPIQAQAVPLALKGRDLIGLAMTGTGKTAAFVIPIIERLLGGPHRTRALILTPTRELCVQVEESFRKYGKHSGLGVIPVYGGVGYEPQVKALRAGVDVVVATPGRLLDHLEKQNVVLDEVEILVLDEADRMLDMGFAPQINRIVAQLHAYRQTLLFSATMPPEVEALARKYLRKPVVVQVGRRSGAATTVQHFVYPCPKDKKTSLLTELLKKESLDSVLVFTRTKHGADRLVRHLHVRGIKAEAIHGNKTQNARQRALENFRNEKMPVLVATDIASRGIDIDGISHVVNYDLTHEPETYVHRIGRTARAGASGAAIALCDPEELPNLRAIERLIRRAIPVKTDHPIYSAPTPKQFDHADERSGEQRHEHRPRRSHAVAPQRHAAERTPHTGPASSRGSHATSRASHAPSPAPTHARHAAPRAAATATATASRPASSGRPQRPGHRKGQGQPGRGVR